MGKHKVKPNYRRRSLRLPDLDHCKRAVLNSLGSLASRRVHRLVLLRAPPRLQPHRGCPLPHALGITWSGSKYHQSTTRGCAKTRARSC
jgi:hypothetical protein